MNEYDEAEEQARQERASALFTPDPANPLRRTLRVGSPLPEPPKKEAPLPGEAEAAAYLAELSEQVRQTGL